MLSRSLPITRMNPNFVHWQLYNTAYCVICQVIFHIFLSFNYGVKKQTRLLNKKQSYVSFLKIKDTEFESMEGMKC